MTPRATGEGRRAVTLVATGGILLDNVLTADGALHLEGLGGNAVYASAGARLFADRAACVGVVPSNYPEAALARLARAGVETNGVRREAARVEAPEWFLHRPDGSREDGLHAPTAVLDSLGLPRTRLSPAQAERLREALRAEKAQALGFGAFREAHPVEPDDVPAPLWAEADAIHLAPNRLDAQLRLSRRARAAGLLVSLDPGRQTPRMDEAALDEILALCDLVLPSEKELRVLAPGLKPREGVAALARRGRALVIGKLGAAGAAVLLPGEAEPRLVPALSVPAPDPTGAGDAFCGAALAAFALAGDPLLAAACGAVAASFAVEDFEPGALLGATGAAALARLRALAGLMPGLAERPGFDRIARRLETRTDVGGASPARLLATSGA